jgi:hypothetical protein
MFKNVAAFWGHASMNKTDLIENIREINKSAKPEFLARFSEDELRAYLEHLTALDLEKAAVLN